jgi:hypothetical protein
MAQAVITRGMLFTVKPMLGDGAYVAPAEWFDDAEKVTPTPTDIPVIAPPPEPVNPYASRLSNKPKRRWLRRRR